MLSKPLDPNPLPTGEVLPAEAAVKTEPKAEKVPYSDEAFTRIFGRPPVPNTAVATAPQDERSATVSAPAATAVARAPAASLPQDREAVFDAARWMWPARGNVVTAFDGSRSKGISIVGRPGDPVLAANAGKVVYVGNAIQAYGPLVIVKHGPEYLTVYAHNSVILVKEGQWVSAGQKISEMGARNGQAAALHFEVRKLGQPVDPAKVLPAER